MKKKYSFVFYILLAFGFIINVSSFIYFKEFTNSWDYYVQLVGLLLLVIYQVAIHNNKAKIIGISGILIDIIQIAICVHFKIWGLTITYMFGITTELYLTLRGKDHLINQTKLSHYVKQISAILIITITLYIFLHDRSLNPLAITFDLISTILIPIAYYLQAKQSLQQFGFWISSDVTGLVPMLISKDIYSIIAFTFYIIFDSLNAYKWYLDSKD